MSIPLYLAMTAADFFRCAEIPPHIAWMSLHFSPSGPGLSNLPGVLPQGSMVILDDQIPWNGHSHQQVCKELRGLLQTRKLNSLLLDFERPPKPETLALSQMILSLCKEIGCSIGLPKAYRTTGEGALFLPPHPSHLSPDKLPAEGAEVWLEAAPGGLTADILPDRVLLEEGPPLPLSGVPVFMNPALHCCYTSVPTSQGIRVRLFDTKRTMEAKAAIWERLGVTRLIGLYGLWR